MKADMIINQLAHNTGKSRKEVIQMLKEMSANPNIKKQLKRNKHGNV